MLLILIWSSLVTKHAGIYLTNVVSAKTTL